MLWSGVLFVLILVGCWLYCLMDAVLTPAAVFRGMPKAAWIGIIAATFILGAIAWLAFRATPRLRPKPRPRMVPPRFATGPRAAPAHTYVYWYPNEGAADASLARHPAGRFRQTPADGWAPPKGPDDDPDFLRELDHRIKGTPNDEAE